jgi:hypothetical protein
MDFVKCFLFFQAVPTQVFRYLLPTVQGVNFGLKMGVDLDGGNLSTLVFGLKLRVGWKKKTKN